jgi:UTP--glucose-1-phosphate uridylyltransferase
MVDSGNARTSAVTKAVVPAAGLGTRFLPATKATPKEMLPVVDKPAIQYVVEEAVSAGLNDVLLITGRSKRSIEDHFDRAYELEEALTAKEDWDKLSLVRESSELATMHYVRQGDPKGLGHAVLCAAQHVGHEPFAVLLGDDLIDPRDPLLTRMIDIRNQYGGSVVALMEVQPEEVSLYGCAAVEVLKLLKGKHLQPVIVSLLGINGRDIISISEGRPPLGVALLEIQADDSRYMYSFGGKDQHGFEPEQKAC